MYVFLICNRTVFKERIFSLKEMIVIFFLTLCLQVDVATQRGFIPVDERMRVIDANGKLVCLNFSCTNYLLSDLLLLI